ncbi:hypothetical protein GGI43DRAFT_409081 [Trichoderma evansii]
MKYFLCASKFRHLLLGAVLIAYALCVSWSKGTASSDRQRKEYGNYVSTAVIKLADFCLLCHASLGSSYTSSLVAILLTRCG